MSKESLAPWSNAGAARRKLDSWKAIASHLRVSVRTVQRWEEQSGLPVHRVMKDKGSSVFAWQDEVDEWWRSRLIAPDTPGMHGEPDPEEQTAPDPAPVIPPASGSPPGRRRRVTPVAVVSAMVAFAATAAFLWKWAGDPLGPLTSERVTVMPGLEWQVDVSPRRDRIAFAWVHGGMQGIAIQDLASGVTQRISQSMECDFSVQWSPDGTRLAFLRHTGGTAADVLLWDGKAVERVDSMSGPNWQDTIRAGPYLQWTTDGRSVLVTGCNRNATKWWVERLDVTTKSRTQVLEAEAPILGLALAPSGRELGLVLQQGNSSQAYTVRLREGWRVEGKPVPLAPSKDRQFALTYLPDGRAAFLESDGGGASEDASTLPVVMVKGKLGVRRLTLLQRAGPNLVFDVASDGRMYWASVPFDTSVREYDPRTGQVGEALCDSSSMERVPHLSPNGRTLAFVSNREGRTNIWTCDLETQAVTAVTRYARAGTWMPRWSPDASMLAFRLAEQNGPWRVAIWRRGQSVRMITPSNLSVSHFSWAPDSQTLHFLARAEDTPRHYTVRVDGSALQDLGDTGATEIDVRADGQIWLRQNAELILWDRSTGARRVFPAPKATLWGLDQDRMAAFLTVKAVPGLYGLEAVLFREGQSPRKVAPANVPRTMGWHPGPNGRLYAVQHEPVDGDIYRSAPIP